MSDGKAAQSHKKVQKAAAATSDQRSSDVKFDTEMILQRLDEVKK
jgi:hypothetical protein